MAKMVYLKAKVTCFHCKKQVEKAEARIFDAPLGGPSYECFNCFKKSRMILGEDNVKLDLYCERCNYRFKSKARAIFLSKICCKRNIYLVVFF